MKRPLFAMMIVLATSTIPSPARAQGGGVAAAVSYYSGTYSIYGAPGYYGTSYGTASYRVPRLDSEFASPYGPGSAYGYGPYALAPGRFGVGLWRPGFATAGYVYGSAYSYRTFPASTWPVPSGNGPPFGVYAPAFGPSPLPER